MTDNMVKSFCKTCLSTDSTYYAKGGVHPVKENRTYRLMQWLLRLLPVAILAVLLIPGLNPARFLPFISDWSYVTFLQNTMEVDKLFTAAFPGVRELFAVNALVIFCNVATLVGLIVMAVCAVLSFVNKKKLQKTAYTVIAAASSFIAVMQIVSAVRIFSAKCMIIELGYDAMGMQYNYPIGLFILVALGIGGFAIYQGYRRLWMKQEHLYIPMTSNEKRENLRGFLFISPYLIGFSVFIAFPLLFSFFSSFTYYNITAVQKWYGLGSFNYLFTKDPMFWKSLGNTLYYVVFSVPLVIITAMVLALLMNMRVRFMGLFRTIYYLPSVLSGVAVYLLWQWIFDPSSGLLNNALSLFGIKGPAWLYDAQWTKPAMIIMRIWSTGGTMILLLAALQGVPQDLYEAGAVDGAVGFRKFRYITLPMISPTLFFIMITGISGAFQVYDQAFIMVENGGPGKSLLFYNLHLWYTAFRDQSMGLASAMAWILFAIIMFFTVIQMVGSKKWVHYEGGN